MPAGADLEVEGAVHLVLFGAEDGRQVLSHDEGTLDALNDELLAGDDDEDFTRQRPTCQTP